MHGKGACKLSVLVSPLILVTVSFDLLESRLLLEIRQRHKLTEWLSLASWRVETLPLRRRRVKSRAKTVVVH